MPRLIPILDAQGNYSDTVDLESARCIWQSLALDVALYRLPSGLCLLTDTSFRSFPPLTTGQVVTREQAINWLLSAHEVPPDELLCDGESVDATPAKPRQNVITVYDAGTGKPMQLDADAGEKWIGKGYRDDFDGIEGYYLWNVDETLYRRKGWILVEQRHHNEAGISSDPTFRWLTGEQAAEWQWRNGHQVSADIAHHVAGRSLDEAEPDPRDYEAEQQEKAARMVTDFVKWFDEATAPPSDDAPVEALSGNTEDEPALSSVAAVAVESATESKADGESATLQIVAGRVPVAPPTDFELAAMWAPSQLAKRFGLNLGAVNKALERWRAKHGDGWHEVENRKPREPKYTYRLSAVLPLLNEMLAAPSEQGASSEMSA